MGRWSARRRLAFAAVLKSMSGEVVVVGSINADLMVTVARHPAPGETLPGSGGQISPGGKGANQALAAARVGASVTLLGAVGTDAYADEALRLLHDSVDLTGVKQVDGVTGLAIVAVDNAGENSIIVIFGANAEVDGDYIESHSQTIRSASVVVIQGEIPAESNAVVCALLTDSDTRIILNLAPVIAMSADVIRAANPLVVNEHEGALTLEQLCGETDARTPAKISAALYAAGVKSVVMTLGAQGALVTTELGQQSVPSPAVDVVDTTGAGDAFVGALAAHLVAHPQASLYQAAAFACTVGARACTGHGAQSSYGKLVV